MNRIRKIRFKAWLDSSIAIPLLKSIGIILLGSVLLSALITLTLYSLGIVY